MILFILFLKTFYIITGIILALYLFFTAMSLVGFLRLPAQKSQCPAITDWPFVTVMLPVYNEKMVVNRLLKAVSSLKYPQEKLQVLILDDSTDATSDEIDSSLVEIKNTQPELDINVIRRPERIDYKTGALRESMHLVKGDFIVVFDADFVPSFDFLNKTIPYIVQDSRVGFIQTRWTFLNQLESLATITQGIGLDIHFGIEKCLEQNSGLFVNYNGSAGVWRKSAIVDSGGWPKFALSEDLELSYRAQIKGWKALYLPNVCVPSELPASFYVFGLQQERWAFGAIQALRRLWQQILSGELGIAQRLHALSILGGYNFTILILILPSLFVLLLRNGDTTVWPMVVLACMVFLNTATAILVEYRLYSDWQKRVLYVPLFILGTLGVSVRVSWGVILGFLRQSYKFVRTPKLGATSSSLNSTISAPPYAKANWRKWIGYILVEFGFSAWFCLGIYESVIRHLWVSVFVLAFYVISLFIGSFVTLVETNN